MKNLVDFIEENEMKSIKDVILEGMVKVNGEKIAEIIEESRNDANSGSSDHAFR